MDDTGIAPQRTSLLDDKMKRSEQKRKTRQRQKNIIIKKIQRIVRQEDAGRATPNHSCWPGLVSQPKSGDLPENNCLSRILSQLS